MRKISGPEGTNPKPATETRGGCTRAGKHLATYLNDHLAASVIKGKRALWEALAEVSGQVPLLRGFDYRRLIRRAREQHDRVESVRLGQARLALV